MTVIESIPEDIGRGWVPAVMSDFGARLALVRHRMKWNVKEAAMACGIPAASWRGWELEGASPRDLLSAVNKIADRTGCDIIWLAGFPVTAQRDQDAWDWPHDVRDSKGARPEGFEPPTFWFGAAPELIEAEVIPFPVRPIRELPVAS